QIDPEWILNYKESGEKFEDLREGYREYCIKKNISESKDSRLSLVNAQELPNPEKLTYLALANNKIGPRDLTIFSRLVNLRHLLIGSSNLDNFRALGEKFDDFSQLLKKSIEKGFYNRFYGSLKPLEGLTKLEVLNISETDINDGLEYLPDSLEGIVCDSFRKDAGVNKIIEVLKPYKEENYYNIKRWKKSNKKNYIEELKRQNLQIVEKEKDSELMNDHPAAQLYNNEYSRKLPSLKQNYENITKKKVKLFFQENPDDYLKQYDIVKRKIDNIGISHHYAIYLGNNQVAHISGSKEVMGETDDLYARIDS
ncbi:1398_t:CDS:2, partial [Paraglomus brasilianum]